MKFRTITLIFILCFCSIFSTACQAAAEPEWAATTADEAYSTNTVIFTGTAINVRETTLNYEYLGTKVSDPITIFDVELSDVLSCRSGSYAPGDTVTVGVGYNSSNRAKELPVIKEGSSYLAFSYAAADKENDPTGLADRVDLWIGNAKDLLIEKTDGSYLTTEFFSEVPGTAAYENGYYLIDCSELEEHIRNTSLAYAD